MRHGVIIRNPNGPKPEAIFFAALAEAKPAFKALKLADGEHAELWSSTSGRIRRKRGNVVEEVKPEPFEEIPVAPAPAEVSPAPENQKPAKRGRNQ